MLITKTARNVDKCWTNHKLLISHLKISIRRKPPIRIGNPPRKRFNTAEFNNNDIKTAHQEAINNQLAENPSNPEIDAEWTMLKIAEDTIRLSRKKNVAGFSKNKEEIEDLIKDLKNQDLKSNLKKTCFQELKWRSEISKTNGGSSRQMNRKAMQTLTICTIFMLLQKSCMDHSIAQCAC